MNQKYIQNILSSIPGVNFVFKSINCVSHPLSHNRKIGCTAVDGRVRRFGQNLGTVSHRV